MATSEISLVDLECGGGGGGGGGDGGEEEEGNVFFSDADEGSCYSQFYFTVDGDGSYDDYSIACGSECGEILEDEVLDSRRASSVADSDSSDCSVDIENGGIGEIKVHFEKVERDCRICHLSLVSSSPESGVAIELGCSCKDDLAAAHKHCAETWFKIKGNKYQSLVKRKGKEVCVVIEVIAKELAKYAIQLHATLLAQIILREHSKQMKPMRLEQIHYQLQHPLLPAVEVA
ncbi:uncharacterized protein LOC111365233 [Olea europaea var. sylvestris]|uniref:uncharacterized protein LOC111365233 n=1 Tax=Olea europaea var. sylvestris TaxID=158386 RepID=UPI000C1D1B1A|nr:uncharacterized protein LOC111365233 [Olea europaea var. sylvestris]